MKTIALDDKSYELLKELLNELTEEYIDDVEYSNSCGGYDTHYVKFYGESYEEDSVVGMAKTLLSKLTEVEQRDIKIESVVSDE
jgi:hypothetical protein